MLKALVAMAACAFLAGSVFAEDTKKPKKADPEAQFKKLDANGDGKITREEFAKMADSNPKLKEKPQALDKRFQLADANADGAITLEEFKKLGAKKKKDPK
jgi:Ca2+-binding EF-hand superfamily protein